MAIFLTSRNKPRIRKLAVIAYGILIANLGVDVTTDWVAYGWDDFRTVGHAISLIGFAWIGVMSWEIAKEAEQAKKQYAGHE